MPESIFVENLVQITGVGIWNDHKPQSPDADFARKTIVYGFNGSGKTSLSRIFSSLEATSLANGLDDRAKFQAKFSDGTIATDVDFGHPLGNHLLVFNSDFILRNFQWDKGSALPIFHIDEDNIEKVHELRQLEADLETASAKARAAKTWQETAEKGYKDKGTEIGGRVREARGAGYTQQFNRGNVDREYAEREFTIRDNVVENNIDEYRAIIRQSDPLPKIDLAFELPEGFRDELRSAYDLVQRDFSAQLSSDLITHPSMLGWVAEGHHYHEENHLVSCLYCGNAISDQRGKTLAALFSESWQEQINAVTAAIEWCGRSRSLLRGWLEGFPSQAAVQPTLAKGFGEAEKGFRAEVISTGTAIKELQESLVQRQRNPMESQTVTDNVTNILDVNWSARFIDAKNRFLTVISEHNSINDQFRQRKDAAANALKAHVLFAEQASYRQLKRKAADAEEEAQKSQSTVKELQDKAETLRNAIRKHGVAANELNKLLHEYLGHSSIRLEAKDDGYQLVRADGSIAQNLSEGEKTALTFCFFLTQFGAEGRDKKKLVVVIDDPVSSLDSNAQTYAFGLIKKHTKRVAQVILLTHNLKLMHMAKRAFFRGVNFADTVPQGLLFVDCRDDGKGSRKSALVKMPSHLAKYDSEYQYLFSIVFEASDKRSTDYLYLLPNAIRKLLEIFTAFAAPDKASFAEALFDDSGRIKGLDQAEMNQLERVCQIESHGDIEAVNSLPALTVEESHRAANGAMKYIRERDGKHYDAMLRIVKKPVAD
ncbi:AAA family ATPase [Pseudomonas sp. GX19020]|uniref:AAA family ATPase n=1 Tax=Pseudomonas sp. GX19020 TaxID=2942277 RepID=UPI0020192CC1|nr:AAA family ATPase [Pseudomonas sp. GX19020]MCL4069442.1 AAA family ATPase [Pseudomonas sp. GX19020]